MRKTTNREKRALARLRKMTSLSLWECGRAETPSLATETVGEERRLERHARDVIWGRYCRAVASNVETSTTVL